MVGAIVGIEIATLDDNVLLHSKGALVDIEPAVLHRAALFNSEVGKQIDRSGAAGLVDHDIGQIVSRRQVDV